MNKEIERRFLVIGSKWRKLAQSSSILTQGYLHASKKLQVRVRIGSDKKCKLAIKGPSEGISRDEYEYPIPLREAVGLLDLAGNRVVKRRYRIPAGPIIWEVDVYLGHNRGLVTGEVELRRANQRIDLPEWLGREVTKVRRYSNTRLVKRPYRRWTKKEKGVSK